MATLAPRKYPPFDRLSLSLLSQDTALSPSFHLHPLPLPSNGVHRSLRQLLAVIARNHTRGYYENDSGRCAFLFSLSPPPSPPFFDSFSTSSSTLSFLSTLLQHPFELGNVSAERSRKDTYTYFLTCSFDRDERFVSD